jgi:hypothetical protein
VKGVCTECGATVEFESYYVSGRGGVWIDPDRQDVNNEGAQCPANDGLAHEVAS